MSEKKPKNPVTKSSEAISDQDYYASGPAYALPEPRALRGGGWNYHPSNIGAAFRNSAIPSIRSNIHYGFRIARTAKKPERK